MELCIDTSTRWAGLALARQGVVERELSWHSRQNHTVELGPAVQYLLEGAGATPQDISTILLAVGPGNFSALRVGVSFAKGLALARGVPVVAVGTLEVEAYPYLGLGRPVCPLLDASRGEVAWGLFGGDPQAPRSLGEERVSSLEELVQGVPPGVLFCGEGVEGVGRGLSGRGPRGAVVAWQPPPTRRPAALASLGYRRLRAGQVADPATLQPRYLRSPSITQPRPPRRIT